MIDKSILDRFWAKVLFTNECWEWTSSLDMNGYGIFWMNNKVVKSHRLVYHIYNGQIPDNMVIDHLCRKRNCVNPHHLEVVTPKTNILRGIGIAAKNKIKTHCCRGHLLSSDNIFISKIGSRNCKKCLKIRNDMRPRKNGVIGLNR